MPWRWATPARRYPPTDRKSAPKRPAPQPRAGRFSSPETHHAAAYRRRAKHPCDSCASRHGGIRRKPSLETAHNRVPTPGEAPCGFLRIPAQRARRKPSPETQRATAYRRRAKRPAASCASRHGASRRKPSLEQRATAYRRRAKRPAASCASRHGAPGGTFPGNSAQPRTDAGRSALRLPAHPGTARPAETLPGNSAQPRTDAGRLFPTPLRLIPPLRMRNGFRPFLFRRRFNLRECG